jgi:hypothetical protein
MEYKRGKYHCTIDLLCDWFGISCMTTENFCVYLQNRPIQTSQTGGQWYSDISPFSIPWFDTFGPFKLRFEISLRIFDFAFDRLKPSRILNFQDVSIPRSRDDRATLRAAADVILTATMLSVLLVVPPETGRTLIRLVNAIICDNCVHQKSLF